MWVTFHFVSLFVSPLLCLVRFGHLLRNVDKHILAHTVNQIKVYIERNNLQVELLRCRKNCWLYSRLLLRSDGFNAFAHRTQIY